MNDKLQSELALWLSEIRATAAQGRDFALEQAPDFVREIVALGRTWTTMVLIGYAAMVLGAFAFAVLVERNIKADDPDDVKASMLLQLASFAAGSLGVFLFLANLHPFLLAWFAPKVYAVGQIAEMIRALSGK